MITLKPKSLNNELDDLKIIEFIESPEESLNNKALYRLYSEYFELIQNYVINNSGTSDDAKDLFQDSLIVFYKKIKSGDLSLNCTIKTYIYSICKNKWMDKLRLNKNRSRIIADEVHRNTEHVYQDKELESNERKEILQRILGFLGKDCKKVLYYYYYDRISMKDIAEKMGYSGEQSAKNKKLKCLNYLRKKIGTGLISEII